MDAFSPLELFRDRIQQVALSASHAVLSPYTALVTCIQENIHDCIVGILAILLGQK